MAKINGDQLTRSLKSLNPVYLVTGDEPLLVQEACIQIRQAAKKQGFTQHERQHTDAHFHWPDVMMSANTLSLFAEKKLIEITIHNGKPGDAGGKVLRAYCANPPQDTVLLLVSPKIDKRSESSAWFKDINACGTVVTIWPVNAEQLPRFLDQRLKQAGLQADAEAIAILASKVEGNLLAAVQEIEKMKLVVNDKIITSEIMANAVVDSARYNVFTLVDKAMMGDARQAVQCLSGLQAEGNDATVILWALTNAVRTLLQMKEMQQSGHSFEAASKRLRIWNSKKMFFKHALKNMKLNQLQQLLRKCAATDNTIKGMRSGNTWNELLDIVLGLACIEALDKRSQKLHFSH